MIKNKEAAMKILIVDDSPMQQKIARIYLEKGEGHTVISACNGKEGLELAKTDTPELILLDVDMPEMNGLEVLKELKKTDYLKDIPVIMCTASETMTEEELKQLGALAYIKKPHGFRNLKGIINSIK